MRIPPSTAAQIGVHFAAARVNDQAARDLDASARLLSSAAQLVRSNRSTEALGNATKAADLLVLVSKQAPSLSPATRQATEGALAALGKALPTTQLGRSDAAFALLLESSRLAGAGAVSATATAAGHRSNAEDLSGEHL